LNKWQEDILFPKLAVNSSKEEIAQFEKIKVMSNYFGGSAQTNSTQVSETKVNLPTPQVKSPSTVTKTKKKKREGC
jgi:hypothetical protein